MSTSTIGWKFEKIHRDGSATNIGDPRMSDARKIPVPGEFMVHASNGKRTGRLRICDPTYPDSPNILEVEPGRWLAWVTIIPEQHVVESITIRHETLVAVPVDPPTKSHLVIPVDSGMVGFWDNANYEETHNNIEAVREAISNPMESGFILSGCCVGTPGEGEFDLFVSTNASGYIDALKMVFMIDEPAEEEEEEEDTED